MYSDCVFDVGEGEGGGRRGGVNGGFVRRKSFNTPGTVTVVVDVAREGCRVPGRGWARGGGGADGAEVVFVVSVYCV